MKMKNLLALLLAVLLLPIAAVAEETEADTLLLSELTEWAERYHARAMDATPLNDPAKSQTGEGSGETQPGEGTTEPTQGSGDTGEGSGDAGGETSSGDAAGTSSDSGSAGDGADPGTSGTGEQPAEG